MAAAVSKFFRFDGVCHARHFRSIHLFCRQRLLHPFEFLPAGRKLEGLFYSPILSPLSCVFGRLAVFLVLNPAHDRSWFQFIEHALLIQNFNSQTFFGINPSFWSIAVEVQLYLLYPLLLALVNKYGWKSTLLILAVVECFIHGWEASYQTLLGISAYDYPVLFRETLPYYNYADMPLSLILTVSPLAYWFSWSLGAAIGDAFLKNQRMPFAKWPVRVWVLLLVASYVARPLGPFFFTFASLLAAMIICKCIEKAMQDDRPPENFLLKQLCRIGVWSYSLYLLNQPLCDIFCTILTQFFPKFSPLFKYLFCLAFLAVIIPFAGLWYRFVEIPAIELGKRIVKLAATRAPIKLPTAENVKSIS